MPNRPKQYHSSGKTRAERRRDFDRTKRPAWHAWYSKEPWLGIRKARLAQHPLCEDCRKENRDTLATVVDHDPPHKGDYERFVSGPFASLCKRHHDIRTATRDGGFGR